MYQIILFISTPTLAYSLDVDWAFKNVSSHIMFTLLFGYGRKQKLKLEIIIELEVMFPWPQISGTVVILAYIPCILISKRFVSVHKLNTVQYMHKHALWYMYDVSDGSRKEKRPLYVTNNFVGYGLHKGSFLELYDKSHINCVKSRASWDYVAKKGNYWSTITMCVWLRVCVFMYVYTYI